MNERPLEGATQRFLCNRYRVNSTCFRQTHRSRTECITGPSGYFHHSTFAVLSSMKLW